MCPQNTWQFYNLFQTLQYISIQSLSIISNPFPPRTKCTSYPTRSSIDMRGLINASLMSRTSQGHWNGREALILLPPGEALAEAYAVLSEATSLVP